MPKSRKRKQFTPETKRLLHEAHTAFLKGDTETGKAIAKYTGSVVLKGKYRIKWNDSQLKLEFCPPMPEKAAKSRSKK